MDELMSPPSPPPPPPPPAPSRQHQPPPQQQMPQLPIGVNTGEYAFARSNGHSKVPDSVTDDDVDGDDDDEESDGMPPPPPSDRGFRVSYSSYRMLAESIRKFGEIYEKMEHSKRQQMAELERMRKDFQRELEVQKRQILERAQAEIAKIREEEGEEDEDTERTEDDDDNDEDGIDASAENLSG
ncbi:Trihelix transcription factor ASIL2 [Ananas comosus]|nr:Trihelix transcription factor ASIL2 [Ananas comosus]